jgi:hypothetical protein
MLYKYHLPPSLDGGLCNAAHFFGFSHIFAHIVAKAEHLFYFKYSPSKDGGN